VDKDLAAVGTLLAQQKELARHYQQIAQHEVSDVRSAPARQGPEWLRSAQILAAQAAAYSPESSRAPIPSPRCSQN
jgi:hypothetical protein